MKKRENARGSGRKGKEGGKGGVRERTQSEGEKGKGRERKKELETCPTILK